MNEFFEKISKNITDTGKVVTEKTKQVSESAKLNSKIVSSDCVSVKILSREKPSSPVV